MSETEKEKGIWPHAHNKEHIEIAINALRATADGLESGNLVYREFETQTLVEEYFVEGEETPRKRPSGHYAQTVKFYSRTAAKQAREL